MSLGRRGAKGGPAATWPGIPLGAQRVFVPVGEDGQPWGTREHGQLFVQARRAHEPHEDARGVRYQEMTVAELCRRLPPGATAGIGRLARLVDCSATALDRAPAQVDLAGLGRDSRVRPADVGAWGLEPWRPPLESARMYDVVDTRAMLTAALVVVDRADGDVVDAFLGRCAEAQVAAPLQLWESDDLPGWLRRATRG